jgi:hypothetical protein
VRADWLLENGRVLTLDPRRPVGRSLAVGRGRVLEVGATPALPHRAGPATERIDCRGATVVPGLVDPHLHLFGLAAGAVELDCSGPDVHGIDDLLAAVRAAATRASAGSWVRGGGLDERRLGRLPTAEELDAAAGGRPVRLRHRSRHASVLSLRALRRLGDARGVERHRGRPTGLVSGREERLRALVGPLPSAALAGGLLAAARQLAGFGVTTVADATPRRRAALAPLAVLMAAGRFPLRVVAMRPPGAPRWRDEARLAPGAVKLLVEEDRRGFRPRPATLGRRIAAAAAAGDQVAVHCLGAETLVTVLDAFAALPAALRAGRRHRLEHVAECPPPLVPRIAALGLVVVTNPAFVYWRGDAYREETEGVARGWLYRARSLAAAGVRLAAASDAPVVPPNPWVGLAAARARRTAGGRSLGAAERLDAAAALRLFTTGAAFALGRDRLGRIVPGGPADVALVEPDPVRAPPDEVAAARVRLTLVGGEAAWRA